MLSATCTADDDHFNVPGNFPPRACVEVEHLRSSLQCVALLTVPDYDYLSSWLHLLQTSRVSPTAACCFNWNRAGGTRVRLNRQRLSDWWSSLCRERERESRYLNPLPEFRASTLMKIYCSALTNAGLLVAISHWIIIFNLEVQLQWKAHHFSNHTSLEK